MKLIIVSSISSWAFILNIKKKKYQVTLIVLTGWTVQVTPSSGLWWTLVLVWQNFSTVKHGTENFLPVKWIRPVSWEELVRHWILYYSTIPIQDERENMSLPAHFGIFKAKQRGTRKVRRQWLRNWYCRPNLLCFLWFQATREGTLHKGQGTWAGVFRTGDYQSSQMCSLIVQLI